MAYSMQVWLGLKTSPNSVKAFWVFAIVLNLWSINKTYLRLSAMQNCLLLNSMYQSGPIFAIIFSCTPPSKNSKLIQKNLLKHQLVRFFFSRFLTSLFIATACTCCFCIISCIFSSKTSSSNLKTGGLFLFFCHFIFSAKFGGVKSWPGSYSTLVWVKWT